MSSPFAPHPHPLERPPHDQAPVNDLPDDRLDDFPHGEDADTDDDRGDDDRGDDELGNDDGLGDLRKVTHDHMLELADQYGVDTDAGKATKSELRTRIRAARSTAAD